MRDDKGEPKRVTAHSLSKKRTSCMPAPEPAPLSHDIVVTPWLVGFNSCLDFIYRKARVS